MKRWTLLLTLALCALCLAMTTPAQAGISLDLSGADFGPAYYRTLFTTNKTAAENQTTALTLTLHPITMPKDAPKILLPTNWDEVVPWAKGNFGIDLPWNGDENNFFGFIGLGASEQVQVAQVLKGPVRLGLAYIGAPDLQLCYSVRWVLPL